MGATQLLFSDSTDSTVNFPGANKIIDEINYKDYVLESNVISKTDIPILTDQYAPVENLLNPISGKPYSIEEQNNTRTSIVGEKIHDPTTLIISIPIILITVVTIIWLFSLRQIWKGTTHNRK